ncbi:MAG: hypothetical protein HYV36_04425 [Lentisphaerae bacterium]|nr:hypothetical protein [Lentisphaerota bacterium]
MRARWSNVLLCLMLGLGLELMASAAPARPNAAQETTLLVVPARLPMVQLAFDLAELRPVAVLSYRGSARAADPLLFFWAGGAWQYVSPDDFRERRFIAAWPRQVVLQMAELINALDAVFHFKAREWQRLARRYNLTITDVNTPRREFNTYDVPRSKLPLASKTFKQEKDEPAPAVLIEPPAAETGKTAPRSADPLLK